MVPVLAAFMPLPAVLLLVGVVHWFGDIWKMLLFRSGIRWRLILLFGVPGIVATFLGSLLVFSAAEVTLSRALGAFLLLYVLFLFFRPGVRVPPSSTTALAGGALSGLAAGLFGVGGAVRGAFLTAYDLGKDVNLFTSGAIGLVIDSGRLATYRWQGAELEGRQWWGLLVFIPISFVGAKLAERIIDRIPQQRFRAVVGVFLALVGLQLLFLPRLH
jgi:uncharacterized membrane protein YfcA